MIGNPKYKCGDKVRFTIKEGTFEGYVRIVDEWGTFENDTEPSYNILVEDFKGGQCIFSHVAEHLIEGLS